VSALCSVSIITCHVIAVVSVNKPTHSVFSPLGDTISHICLQVWIIGGGVVSETTCEDSSAISVNNAHLLYSGATRGGGGERGFADRQSLRKENYGSCFGYSETELLEGSNSEKSP
jgi:hypothetical protein